MAHTPNTVRIGDVVGTQVYQGREIRKRVAWVAYAVNGNTGNPTLTFEWDVYEGGRLQDRFTRLKDAKAAIAAEVQA
jgi:hypothetical protein